MAEKLRNGWARPAVDNTADRIGAPPGMMRPRLLALLAMAVTLGGCEFAQDAVAPSITGQAPTAVQPAPKIGRAHV